MIRQVFACSRTHRTRVVPDRSFCDLLTGLGYLFFLPKTESKFYKIVLLIYFYPWLSSFMS